MVDGSGDFTHRVIVERLIAAPDPPGRLDVTDPDNWEDYCTRWAQIIPSTGKEFHASDATRSHITHKVMLYFDPETRLITPKMRLKWEDSQFGQSITRYLNIEYKLETRMNENSNMRFLLQLQCQEVL